MLFKRKRGSTMEKLKFYLSNAKGFDYPDSAKRLKDFCENSEHMKIAEKLWEEALAPEMLRKIADSKEEFFDLLAENGLYVQLEWERKEKGQHTEGKFRMEPRIYPDSCGRVACIKVYNLPVAHTAR